MKLYIQSISVVFRSLLLLLLINVFITAEELLPRPSGPVADYAAVLDTETEQMINSIARKLWVEYRFGLVVVTLPAEVKATTELYVRQLFDTWGIGRSDEALSALMAIGSEAGKVLIIKSKRADAMLPEKEFTFLAEQSSENGDNENVAASEVLLHNVTVLKNVIRKNYNQPLTAGGIRLSIGKWKLTIGLSILMLLIVLFVFFKDSGAKFGSISHETLLFGGSINDREFGGGIKNR